MMTSRKVQDWTVRLAAYVEESRHRPFVWGQHDCCLYAGGWMERAIDAKVPIVQEARGAYHDKLSALRWVRSRGESSEGDPFGIAFWMKVAGALSIPRAFAGRGDLVLMDYADITAVGVCLGNSVTGPGEKGLLFLPRKVIKRAWRF